jgi:ribosomal protein L7Ae-like RNA K-turn-binding protein
VQVDISFVINYCAEYGQQVVLVGSCQELGSWDTSAAVRLVWQQGDNWKAAVQLPAPTEGCVREWL